MLLSYNADLLPRVRMLGRINYTEPWIHFSRTIDEYVLYVIRDGNMYLQEDGIFYHLKAGDFFLLEPGLCHEGYQRAACNYYYAHFTHPEMARVEDEDAAMALLAEKRRLSLVSYNLDDADPTDPITYLPKQFHLPGSEFNTIEDVFEMNFDYMNRAFSKLTDAPIFTYLNTLRIYNAQQLIATTDLPFQEIAYLVGIDDRYYVPQLFRKKTGMSPSEYYKEVRNRGDAERL